MILSPKRTKYKKHHRGRMKGKVLTKNALKFGKYGLQSLEPSWITSSQIEAARRVIMRLTKRNASLWIRIFPDKPITSRSAESRWVLVKVT
jgi:large subunit ribosomal protein L16